MKKSTFKRLGAMFATAFMTIASSVGAMTTSASDYASMKLTEASGVAGQLVTVNLVLETDDTCIGYIVDVDFDERLELKEVGGYFSTETNGNVATIINLTGKTFKDNKAVSSLTFEIPKDAEEGETFDIGLTSQEFRADSGLYVNPTVTGTTISVLESAKKVTNYMVFVTEEDGVAVSKVALRGDANLDGKVNLYDTIMIAEKMVKRSNMDNSQSFFADVNQDGAVNLYDAIAISRFGMSTDKANAWGKII